MTIHDKLAQVREVVKEMINGEQVLPLLDEIEAALPVWRPIDTAPKDGTRVLVSNGDLCAVCWYSERFFGWCITSDDNDYGTEELQHPTHWMPLPPAPEGK